jgi:hypothetical protein
MKTQPTVSASAPAWQVRLLAELDAADSRAVTLARDLSDAQLNWKPRPDAWSVGQCLEHLCLSNEVYVKPIVTALERYPAAGPVDEITPGWFARWFIRNYIEPTTQKKPTRAPSKAVPIALHIESSILDRFLTSNQRVRDLMKLALQHDVNRVRFRNPYVALIRFTVGTGFQIIARHNHRHLGQAERVTQSAGFPKA